MSYDVQSSYSRASRGSLPGEEVGQQATWGERMVTIVAASLAILIVAGIAVLMGLA